MEACSLFRKERVYTTPQMCSTILALQSNGKNLVETVRIFSAIVYATQPYNINMAVQLLDLPEMVSLITHWQLIYQ